MKFNDAYRRANDSVHVREGLREEWKLRCAQEAAAEVRRRENRKKWFIAIPTAAAAAAAVFVAVFVGVRMGRGNFAAAAPMAAEAAYEPEEAMPADAPMEAMAEAPMLAAGVPTEEIPAEDALEPAAEAESIGDYGPLTGASTAPEPNAETKGTNTDRKQTESADEWIEEADAVRSDGTRTYALNEAEGTAEISIDGAVTARIDLKEASGEGFFRAEALLPVDDLLFVFGTFETDEAQSETADRVRTGILLYELHGYTFVQTLTQRGTFLRAQRSGDVVTTVSKVGAEDGSYTLYTEIDVHAPSAFRSERTEKTE